MTAMAKRARNHCGIGLPAFQCATGFATATDRNQTDVPVLIETGVLDETASEVSGQRTWTGDSDAQVSDRFPGT